MTPAKRPEKQTEKQPSPARFLPVRLVAAELGVSQEIVRRLIRMGELDCVRIGSMIRVSRQSLEDYLEESRVV